MYPGAFGVMLLWIGATCGAVGVERGIDQVWLPRLPNDPPFPARACASAGAKATARAAMRARREIRIRQEGRQLLHMGAHISAADGAIQTPG